MEDEKGNEVFKCVFIIFYRAVALERKLRRLCDAFDARLYNIPSFDNVHEVRLAHCDHAAPGASLGPPPLLHGTTPTSLGHT